MGKKVKKKARSGQKEKTGSSVSPKTAVQQGTINAETPVNGVADVKDRGLCSHIDRGINLDKLSVKFGSSESVTCEDCRGNVDGRVKKGKGKQGKKGGTKSKSDSKAIWICLECGHFSCGGVGLPTTLQSHAVRHAKQNHHALVVHYENHHLLWCFSCNRLIPTEKSEDSKHREVLNEVDKIMKGRPGERSTVDVEGVWFGSGSVMSAVQSDYSSSIGTNGRAGYSVRGLVNLGNTCFFNSIMQNLLAINSFRDYFKLDDSIGPLTAAIRKLFLEISSETSSKSAINPRALFGSLCIKAPQFRGYQQHDSHELLRCLLDGLSTEELSARKHNKSNDVSITDPTFVDAVFGGRLSSTVSCLECGHSSTIYEPFLDLSLPVPTKKPQEKKSQPAARGKKSKLPPKKSGRNLSKISKEASAVRGDTASVQSNSAKSSREMPIAPPGNQLALSGSDSAFSDSIDPNTLALDMGFTAEDLSAIQKPKIQQTVQNVGEPSTSSDSFAFSWLDYLDVNPASHVADVSSEIDEISANQGLANEDSLQTSTSLSINLDSTESDLANAVSATSLNDNKKFNSLEPIVPAQASWQVKDKQNVKPEFNQMLPAESSFSEEVQGDVDLGHSADSCQQDCSRDSNTSGRNNECPSQIPDVKPQFNETSSLEYSCIMEVVHCGADLGQSSDSCNQVHTEDLNTSRRDNELPSQIHDSEDRLLLNNEAASSGGEGLRTETEVSPLVLGDDPGRDNEHSSQIQDSEVRLLPSKGYASSSDALGTEIEVSSVAHGDEQDSFNFDGFGDLFNEPAIALDHPVSEGKDASKSGVIGNSSESDPDEVDNADAPVSVESCLALFTKPEFLSKDEHAWQCDNCSKVMSEQRNRLRNKAQMSVSDIVPNGYEDRNPRGLVDIDNTCNKVRTTNGNHERDADHSDGSSLTKNKESCNNGKCMGGQQPESEMSVVESHSESSGPQMINECPGTVQCSIFSNQNLNPCHVEYEFDQHGFAESNLDYVKHESEGSEQEEASLENLKVKRDATKSILINKSPSILTIHLKRFSQDARGRLSKLNGHVNFRDTIDLKPYTDSRCSEDDKLSYHLVGVVEHLGTMRGGHYVAYVRGTKNSEECVWYHASDACVREASLEEVLRCEAYILFYQRS